MTPRTVKEKSTWSARVSKAIGRVFSFLKLIVQGLWEIIENLMGLVAFFFSLLVKVLAAPSTPCIVAISFFMAVSIVAAIQWWGIGVWIGTAFGLGGTIGGLSSGLLGTLLGLGVNTYQLAPQLWKLRRDVAKAYAELGVDLEHDTSDPTLSDKRSNWYSYDHSTLKKGRLLSYVLETSLVIAYVALVQRFNFIAILQAGISLLLPERALEMVASAVSLLGEVSQRVANPEPETEPAQQTQQGQQQAQRQRERPSSL
jgi:hypothetical protein